MTGKLLGAAIGPNVIRRRLPEALDGEVRSYAEIVGRVSWAMNTVQVNFQAMFCALVDQEDVTPGSAIWHALTSDDAQRSILKQLAAVKMKNRPRDLKSLSWALQNVGILSGYRNDAIHTPTAIRVSRGKFIAQPNDYWGKPVRIARLQQIGHEKLFDALFGDLLQLYGYTHALRVRIDRVFWFPLPRRPILRAIQLVQKSPPAQSSKKHRRAKRKRTPQPS